MSPKLKPYETDDHLGKAIEIKCQGAAVLSIDEVRNFQGKLKTLSEESYQRLKQSILDLGFSFPLNIWKHNGRNLIIDAHQRVDTMLRMRSEGYIIPPLPVVYIDAKDKQEAARKVLAATSQYGEIKPDNLHSFLTEFNLDVKDMIDTLQFPEIDFDSFRLAYYPEDTLKDMQIPTTIIGESGVFNSSDVVLRKAEPTAQHLISNGEFAKNEYVGMPEFIQEDKTSIRQVIVHFKTEQDVKNFFKLINQNDTGSTKSIWFPYQERNKTELKRYE